MAIELKILFVEDYQADAELAKQILSKEGITFQSRIVENEADFINELENFVPDVIISDFALPNFDAMEVLKITLERKPEIPVILLTGSIDEATAVECIKTGAMDYIFKSHLSRLPFSIKEAIEKKKAIAEKESAEYELKKSEERYRLLFEISADGILIADIETKTFTYANPAICKMLGYTTEQFATLSLADIHPKHDLQRIIDEFETV
ncbi:MAG: response regulator, partial [Ignavibacteria bacterium]|nr:response regulator [Ignavibacteria bacterium]